MGASCVTHKNSIHTRTHLLSTHLQLRKQEDKGRRRGVLLAANTYLLVSAFVCVIMCVHVCACVCVGVCMCEMSACACGNA